MSLSSPLFPTAQRRGAGYGALRRRQRGSNVIEMALVAPVFFLILFGIIEFSLMYFSTLTMQYAVREGARYAITGQSDDDPNTANQQRYLAVIQKMKDSSMGMYAKVNPTVVVNNTSYANSAAYTANMFGAAGDIVVIQLHCSWPLLTPLLRPFFPGGVYQFVVGTTMLNEGFGP
ncbi:TadE/TadG family type IV pilus assembly protein [Rugamonas sp.]|uniref:TadE/TadG family type IV pilus assembly protein n=1 Tax=Rugamonas sp. TaxID=1926287 RepID=UPI0025D0E8CE|nr:TadE/TadG family type IV pilus assembly protein [Rugamonas sp.]